MNWLKGLLSSVLILMPGFWILYHLIGSATGIAGLNKDQINLLDVQVFYTANALETLPREVLVSKIVFSIVNDTTSTLPSSLRMKPLDVTLHSQLNEISDPETQVKNILSQKYRLSAHELAGLTIKIIDVSVVVDSMIDDHAISSYLLTPQIGTNTSEVHATCVVKGDRFN